MNIPRRSKLRLLGEADGIRNTSNTNRFETCGTHARTQAQRKIRITSKRDSAFEILQRFGHFDRLRYRSLILYLRNVRTLNNFFFFNILRRL